jgi:uncharacterized paraquat-inducible protein A
MMPVGLQQVPARASIRFNQLPRLRRAASAPPGTPARKARCVRCRSVLYRGIHSDASRMAAITLGAVFTF